MTAAGPATARACLRGRQPPVRHDRPGVLAVGFACYALWQFMRAILDRSNDGSDAKGLAKRAQHAVIGVIYVASAVAVVSLAQGSSSGSGGNEQAETAKVLEWPGGRWIVGIGGVALLLYGVWNAYKGWQEKFRKDLTSRR